MSSRQAKRVRGCFSRADLADRRYIRTNVRMRTVVFRDEHGGPREAKLQTHTLRLHPDCGRAKYQAAKASAKVGRL